VDPTTSSRASTAAATQEVWLPGRYKCVIWEHGDTTGTLTAGTPRFEPYRPAEPVLATDGDAIINQDQS